MRITIIIIVILILTNDINSQHSDIGLMFEYTLVVIATDYTANLSGEIKKYSESKIHFGNYDVSLSFKIPICDNIKIDVRPGFLSSNTDYSSNVHLGLYFRLRIIRELFIATGIDASLIGFGEGTHGKIEPQTGIKPFAVTTVGYYLNRRIGIVLSAGKQLNGKYLKGEFTNKTCNSTKYIRYMKWAFKIGVEINF